MANTLNLGKASVKVELLEGLPNIAKDRNMFNFDITADIWSSLGTLGVAFPPVYLESIKDDKGFATFYPTKRRYPIDNFIADAKGNSSAASKSDKPYILWKPTVAKSGVVSLITEKFTPYDLKFSPDYGNNYLGPMWKDDALPGESVPDDDAMFAEWLKTAKSAGTSPEAPKAATASTPTIVLPSTYSITQTAALDGLWWGIESSPFLKENTPFWVTIDRASPPSSSDHDTFIVVSLGIDDPKNAFDFYLGINKKPHIIDYPNGREGKSPAQKMQIFPDDLSKIWKTEGHIELGFMTVGGRLVIIAQKTPLLYTRTSDSLDSTTSKSKNSKETGKKPSADSGAILEAKIGAGKIRIYGSNCQMNINVSPMTFAPIGVAALPLLVIQAYDTNPSKAEGAVTPTWTGVNYKSESGDSIAKMPKDPSLKADVYGVDCKTFYGGGGGSPTGFGLHRQGEVYFVTASSSGIIKGNTKGDYYLLVMKSSDVELDLGGKASIIPNAGCPYFFRLKGRYEVAGSASGGSSQDVSEDVISVSEQFTADDYFMINGTASVTLYNKDGKYDDLRLKQKGIRLSWGWNGTNVPTFTGIVTGASGSETPGKEEITLTCSDYMFLLKNTMIMNSPYYDGMVLFYACRDVIKRAGVVLVSNDWDNTDEYYLPSGYAFTNPAVKFPDAQMLYECVKSMAQRGEAVVYFDQTGVCHIMKLPGGLFSNTSGAGAVPSSVFVSNPAGQTAGGKTAAILDTKNIEYDYSETINRITVFSVDRDTRDGIMYTKSSQGASDNLIYRRTMYLQKPELGRYSVAVQWVDEFSQRAFYPVRKASFKTAFNGAIPPRPLGFCTVDGIEFRIMGVSRKYDAANNDYVSEYNCEWLGGK